MIDFEINNLREKFSRLFVLAIQHKINLSSFTSLLCKSVFISKIEKGKYDPIFDEPIQKTFSQITGFDIVDENTFGIYNDAYWAGKNYFDLYLETKKSFEYIFLKLPLEEMMNLYSIFHEMDFSSLEMLFQTKMKERSILKALCQKYKCSLNDISKETLIPLPTLKKYSVDDDFLYKAEFQTIAKIKNFFDVGFSLFIE